MPGCERPRATLGRTLATKALGYAENQEQELRRVFLDGRLPSTTHAASGPLRTIVVGRKNWLFYGSDLTPTPPPRSSAS
ncbi:MAG: transposase [Myxococcales bacterium]|nr:transposase [Myxococcales bacterium]